MTTTVITGFFGLRADAARAYESLVSGRVRPEAITVIHHEPPGVESFGIRHPAALTTDESSDAITARLERPDAVVLAGGAVSVAGPLAQAIAGAAPAEAPAEGEVEGPVATGLLHAGVSEHEARYVEAAVRRGGTLLVVRADEDEVAAVRELLEGAGGRRLHAIHEELPILRA